LANISRRNCGKAHTSPQRQIFLGRSRLTILELGLITPPRVLHVNVTPHWSDNVGKPTSISLGTSQDASKDIDHWKCNLCVCVGDHIQYGQIRDTTHPFLACDMRYWSMPRSDKLPGFFVFSSEKLEPTVSELGIIESFTPRPNDNGKLWKVDLEPLDGSPQKDLPFAWTEQFLPLPMALPGPPSENQPGNTPVIPNPRIPPQHKKGENHPKDGCALCGGHFSSIDFSVIA
jgi:hypothetical protein